MKDECCSLNLEVQMDMSRKKLESILSTSCSPKASSKPIQPTPKKPFPATRTKTATPKNLRQLEDLKSKDFMTYNQRY